MERRAVVYDAEGGDDHERQGTVWTATSHIVAAVVGSGVLALAWTVAQLGWVVGPLALFGFSCVTYYTSTLLANCYRYPDPVTGAVNREYIHAVRCYLVRQPVGDAGRLHHHREHQHDCCEAGELLPPVGVRCGGVQRVGEHVHGGVRPVPAAPLAAPEPPQHRLALRRRRCHLLRLLLHQPRPLRRQVGLPPRRRPRHPRRRRRRAQGQGLQRPPRPGQHGLLLHLRRRAHRDPGHAPAAPRREPHHEARLPLRPHHDHRLLPPLGMHRLRRLRRRRSREHPHRVRILRALLARRRRQCLRRRAPRRRLPGVRAAHLREARELRCVPVARRQAHQRHLLRAAGAGAAGVGGARGAAQARAPHRDHHVHHAGGHAAAVLQRRAGPHRRARVLAAVRLLPRQHARRQAQDPARRGEVVVAAGHELRLPPHIHRRQHRVRAGHRAQPQDSYAVQDRRLINYMEG